ncbi:protein EsaB [Paludibacterium purpuratum]|uniref:Uncharacterized protein n=1 Tax=Paludibacterium purpuratum TaxID=1144873 RepID=A0A4R7B3I2_9NEIS|nr:protein EsaB [Paludibacterium purpuratum]TDR76580.1 hypothetical protein DFP86_1105 [Paludibacterium purpuratum]
MNRYLDPAGALQFVAGRVTELCWPVAGVVLSGRLGTGQCRARSFAYGPTVALTVERAPARAAEACLVLAATPAASDDGLYLDDGRLWLLRRYPPRLTESEFDLLLKQQQTLAILLAERRRPADCAMPVIGRLA